MTFSRLVQWLISGSDVQTLSKHWLQTRCPEHDAWTRSQQAPGLAIIVSDTRTMQRHQFWARLANQTPRLVKNNVRRWKVSQR